MQELTLLAVAITPFGAVSIVRPGATQVGRDPLDLPASTVRPHCQVVVARWHRTEDGRLEARWLPTAPNTV